MKLNALSTVPLGAEDILAAPPSLGRRWKTHERELGTSQFLYQPLLYFLGHEHPSHVLSTVCYERISCLLPRLG